MQVCTSLQTDNHANTSLLSFLQAGCPSCRPTNSVKALKATKKMQQAVIKKILSIQTQRQDQILELLDHLLQEIMGNTTLISLHANYNSLG